METHTWPGTPRLKNTGHTAQLTQSIVWPLKTSNNTLNNSDKASQIKLVEPQRTTGSNSSGTKLQLSLGLSPKPSHTRRCFWQLDVVTIPSLIRLFFILSKQGLLAVNYKNTFCVKGFGLKIDTELIILGGWGPKVLGHVVTPALQSATQFDK